MPINYNLICLFTKHYHVFYVELRLMQIHLICFYPVRTTVISGFFDLREQQNLFNIFTLSKSYFYKSQDNGREKRRFSYLPD